MPERANRMAVVLAAGKGTRMESDLPKVLYPVGGRPMIEWVLDALEKVDVVRVLLVVGYRSDLVREKLAHRSGIEFVEQTERLGTGHAVKICRDHLADHSGAVLIVTGDSPLIQPASVNALFDVFDREKPAAIIGTLHKENPYGLGRIVRDDEDRFLRIVEEKDATESERGITEVNMSTYVFNAVDLVSALDRLRNDNRQGEYYITDCPGILRDDGASVRALACLAPCEALSINTVAEAAIVEQTMKELDYRIES